MKVKNKKTYYLKPWGIHTDEEFNQYEGYGEPIEIHANIYKASGQVQAMAYGQDIQYIKNMLCDEDIEFKENDGICVNIEPTSEPDYKIISLDHPSHWIAELRKI